MIPPTHRQIRLAARPTGYPTEGDFRLVESPVPEPGPGELLVRVVREGKLKYREDIVDGLERAPEALIGVLEGRNFGTMIVRVGPEPASVRAPGATAGREAEGSR